MRQRDGGAGIDNPTTHKSKMRKKLLFLVSAIACLAGLASSAKADIIIVYPDGHTQTITNPYIWGVVVYSTNGNAVFTPTPSPKPSNTAN